VKYDDASWHSGGDFPHDLRPDAAGTHTGMFLAWALLSGSGGDLHLEGSPAPIEKLRSRSVTPGSYFISECDGKFTDEDLNDIGNQFATEYYAPETGQFLVDYQNVLGAKLPSLYHIADSWQNFDKIKPTIDERFRRWCAGDRNHEDQPKSADKTTPEVGSSTLEQLRSRARIWFALAAINMVCALLFLLVGVLALGLGVCLIPALMTMIVAV
jgi:hypothetical protein